MIGNKLCAMIALSLAFVPLPLFRLPVIVPDRPVRRSVVLLPIDYGDQIYATRPGDIVKAIRYAEGVPSYGVMWLAKRHGGLHTRVPEFIGHRECARILHDIHRQWLHEGRPGDFLVFLRDHYAPLGVENDPRGLNNNWLRKVNEYLVSEVHQ